MFNGMANEESEHHHRLLTLYRDKFGERIPLIRRQDVRGFVERQPVWLARPLGRYMDTPFWSASLQVMLGGLLVFAAGILSGSA
jgi:hypothetical protein